MYITDQAIENFIKEDVPYIDLTTAILEIGAQEGRIQFISREEAVLCGSEEVTRIFDKLNIKTKKCLPSGTLLKPNVPFIEGEGNAENLHMAWKVSLNILEYCSGIATKTKKLVDKAKEINPNISIVTTRKSFPGTKELAIKSIISGGAYPHRIGLSETILIFEQHINFIGGIDNLVNMISKIKSSACEKKIIVEVESLDNALKLCMAGVDGIQFDKIAPYDLKDYVSRIKNINPHITTIAAGGINENNIADYAQTGVDAIATTSVYFSKPIDMSAKIIKS
ncbi:ModD protein [Clostridium polyendosporum]|uniref:Putative pyrophosphorylase ModD n=1 Tax=Clostridium polyendosporum TaxID=69208 RepID=A0A919VDA6_9CLOT|nr:ModD protein [Clostridium polyendosporum]GIM27779.1 ModD protein [Clostridium polyendosporum]